MRGEERLKLVLSKIAPLESWTISWSDSGPKICWTLFRPNPELSYPLVHIVHEFQGHTKWVLMAGDCLQPVYGRTFVSMPRYAGAPTVAAAIASTLSEDDAESDLTALANMIETKLDLRDTQPHAFSEWLLTKDGLATTPDTFQDFDDRGELAVFLITDPLRDKVYDPSPEDIPLHFAPNDYELTAILEEIIGEDLRTSHGRPLTEAEKERIKAAFPILWEISDYYEDSYLSPQQAEVLYNECTGLNDSVRSTDALRGLDKLIRISRWASKEQYGVLFSAP